MLIRVIVIAALSGAAVMSALPLHADSQVRQGDATDPAAQVAKVLPLTDAIGISDILAVMRQEGIDHGADIADDLFAGQVGAGWSDIVGGIYDTARMRTAFEARLAEELIGDDAATAAGMEFFGSDLGQRIVRLEISARRSLMREPARWVAELAYAELAESRSDQLDRYVIGNDLVESNVMGALNANLAFLHGLTEAGPQAGAMMQEDMLADVWAQEVAIRSETIEWLFPFLALAYQPLSDAELEQYIAFSETPAGKRLNAAFFLAFDSVFLDIYGNLGRAAARQILAQDI